MMCRRLLKALLWSALCGLAWGVGALQAQESFQVNLTEDGATIGDMRPVFLSFSAQAMPAISPREVARRYQRLFDQSDEPAVRIDALNRLTNLHAVAGEMLEFSAGQEERIFNEAIESYEMVLNSGSFKGRLDELLYQSAKAYAYIGRDEPSIERLKQLVGLYPNSSLVPEARFRIAESAFSNGRFAEAEVGYQRVLSAGGGEPEAPDELKSKARYMLGWAQFKLGDYPEAGGTFITVLDTYAELSDNFTQLPAGSTDVVDDTFRIIAIMAAQSNGGDTLAALLGRSIDRPYKHLLYDRLADHYAVRQQYNNSVAVSEMFIAHTADHESAPAFRAQIADVWTLANQPEKARQARVAYVLAYEDPQQFVRLSEHDQQRWLSYSQNLADFYYHFAASGTTGEQAQNRFEQAARYYQKLSAKQSEPGATLRLAGDAWLQAGQQEMALRAFEQAGYEAPGFPGADDAAWAGIRLRVDQLDQSGNQEALLYDLASSADRFARVYPDDNRIPALQADLANRMLAIKDHAEADRFGNLAVSRASISPEARLSAWLVLGATRMAADEFRSAEQAWRQALAESEKLPDTPAANQQDLQQQLATSVYRQAEQARSEDNIDEAVAHFQRIEALVPGSDTAIKGRFDAANTLLNAELWQPAITELQRFRNDFSHHALTTGIGEKLVLAYSSSDQPVRAADELMHLSESGDPEWRHRLRAAELYHQANEIERRNELYLRYLVQVSVPRSSREHVMQQRLRQRLLNSGTGGHDMRVALIDIELASEWHSEETLTWASEAALVLGEQAVQVFEGIRLSLPLADALARKQTALAEARSRYRQAEQLGGQAALSESLFRRAELYRLLARDIIASSRPGGLGDLETAQYELLLEEQAYPFEEKAIELHSRNHGQLADGVFNSWIERSLAALGELFPGRYARDTRWISQNEQHKDGV